MTLTLKILSHRALDNGRPTELVLHNRGAIIGRAATCEWPLPDETRTLSSRHCEIQYRQDDYFLIDHSTNGTYLGDQSERLPDTHKIGPGDRFRMGPYIVEARLSGAALDRHRSLEAARESEAKGPGFDDWNDVPGSRPATPAPSAPGFSDDGGWGLEEAAPARNSNWSEDNSRAPQQRSADDIFDSFADSSKVDWAKVSWSVEPDSDPFATGPDTAGGGFAPLSPKGADPKDSFAPMGIGADEAAATFDEPNADPFGGPLNPNQPAPSPPPPPPPPQPTPPPTDSDPFGGPLNPAGGQAPAGGASSDPFGGPLNPGAGAQEPAAPPAGTPLPPQDHDPFADHGQQPENTQPPVPSATHQPAPSPVAQPPAQPVAGPDATYRALLGALGLTPEQISIPPEAAAAKAGSVLRGLLAGLMILLEARARAKDEMGASATQLRFDGNNPLKFARNVDQALQMMLNPTMRGYMESETAVEDSYRDLQAHQIATLKAMQGALRETINRFSPAAIKETTETKGMLAKVVPGQREAAMWKAYEKQFSGVAEGSAEAFLEVFSKEFREAYEDAVNAD